MNNFRHIKILMNLNLPEVLVSPIRSAYDISSSTSFFTYDNR